MKSYNHYLFGAGLYGHVMLTLRDLLCWLGPFEDPCLVPRIYLFKPL